MEIAALFLAGLSLFFTGMAGLKARLQQLSGRRFRVALARVTNRPVMAGLLGIVFGAVTQSASAVAFIVSAMVATGLITLRRALPVVAASNVGTTVLVFLAAVDLRLAVLFLIGITGLMVAFRVTVRFETILAALFSIGLLFYGLDMMKRAFAPLPDYAWFVELATFLKNWVVAPFLLGAALRMVIQSSSAIGVIAMTLHFGGLFTDVQSALLICGAGPGVALSGLFLSGNVTGSPRQIILFQCAINLISGTGIGLIILLTGQNGFLLSFLDRISTTSASCLALVFLVNMLGCLLVGIALAPWADRWLEKLAPPNLEQDVARPKYIHEEALQVPSTAIDLLDLEQRRLLSFVTSLADGCRQEVKKNGSATKEDSLFAGATGLRTEILNFLKELAHAELASDAATNILTLERRQENLSALLDTVHQFASLRHETDFGPELAGLMDSLTEALHFILLITSDAWESQDPADRENLLQMTGDRGDMMERLRRSSQTAQGTMTENSALFYATTLFERSIWLVRQIVTSFRAS